MRHPNWIIPLLCLLSLLGLVSAGCNTSDRDKQGGSNAPGVTDTTIHLGSSLALTGHARYLGIQTLRGANAFIHHVNDQGGVHGRTIEIIAKDDSYDPPKCLANTQNFIIENNVLALFCYVGTPTTVKALPLVEEARVPLIGMFTGANGLRVPFNRYVVNIRASYYQETSNAVRHILEDLGLTKVAVFYQYDAYGFDGLIGTELELKRHNLEPVARGSYIRGTQNVEEALTKIQGSQAEAVVMVGTYDACSRFVNLAQDNDYTPLFYHVSFVGAEELARRIVSKTSSPVLMSQVVPPPTIIDNPESAAAQYVELLAKYYPGEPPSFVGLEGFLNARIMVEGLKKAGRNLTREALIRAIESIRDFKLGPGMSITYGPRDRQGLESIYFTRLREDGFEPFTDWAGLKKELERRP